MHIIIGERKKVSFAFKSDGRDWPNEVGVDILVRLHYFWLGVVIILFLGFCLFTAIADESFCIIGEFNVVVREMFLQRGEVQVAKFLVP